MSSGSADEGEFRRFLERSTGFQIPEDRWRFLAPRFLERVSRRGFEEVRDYVAYLERDPLGRTELSEIYNLLTVRKTSFFRNPASLDALAKEVLPRLRRERGAHLPLSIWSAGCSTGEEPYSIAMIGRAALGEESPGLYVLATDIVKEALTTAREGIYPEASISSIPPDYRHYMEVVGGRARVRDDLRSSVEFTEQNLVHEQVPRSATGVWDVIFCRNVFIYFSLSQVQDVVRKFWSVLAPGGALFLGHAEVFPGLERDFEVVFWGDTFYYRKREDPRVAPVRAASAPLTPAMPVRLPSRLTSPDPSSSPTSRWSRPDAASSPPRPGRHDLDETKRIRRPVFEGDARRGARGFDVSDPMGDTTFRIGPGRSKTPTRAFTRRDAPSSSADDTRSFRALAQDGALPRDLIVQAEQRLQARDLDGAARTLRAAITRAPRWARARILLARVYMQRGDNAFAGRELETAVEVEPLEPRGHHLLGSLHALRGDHDKAELSYRRALYLEPDLVTARYDLAQSYAALGKVDRGCRELRNVIRTLKTIEPARLVVLSEGVAKDELIARCEREINAMGGSLNDSGIWPLPPPR